MTDPNDPGGYPPQQGGYPPQQQGYPPQQQGYPPQQQGYPPQQQGYPPQQQDYPPQQQGYPAYPQAPGFAPAGQPYPGYAPQYEFSEHENKTVERAAAWCKALSILFFVNAGLQIINVNIIALAIYVGIGVAFHKGAKSLKAVVETEGNDITHLMDALKSISDALLIRLICVGVGVGLLLIIGLIGGLVYLAVS